jgi:hypothetical protein
MIHHRHVEGTTSQLAAAPTVHCTLTVIIVVIMQRHGIDRWCIHTRITSMLNMHMHGLST